MTQLRWILIVCGAALLIGIYLWGRRSSRQAALGDDSMLRMPEPTRVPQSTQVYREESDARVDAESLLPDTDHDEPIGVTRRRRDLDDDEDTIDVDESDSDSEALQVQASVRSGRDTELRRTRIEPTLGDDVQGEASPARFDVDGEATHAAAPADRIVADRPAVTRSQPAHTQVASSEPVTQAAAPTLSMSSTPQPRRTERRKIIALRIAAGSQRFTGEQLLEGLLGEGLQHGKYDVFHRVDDAGNSIFSIASMIEPGTFDPPNMKDETYPGITMFAQMPGPVDSLLAFNELVTSAQRMQEKLGGTLQDERGVPLTIHRVERLRQDVRDFEQRQAHDTARRPDAAPPAS